MSKRKPYTIAGEVFKTKGALQERIRGILYSSGLGAYLPPDNFAFMLDVLRLHPDAGQKIGVGAQAMYVKTNPVYPSTRGFWVVRTDGTETDFSFLECLTETPHAKRFLNACRATVEPVIQAFKLATFAAAAGAPLQCPYTGEVLMLIGSHVDHQAPNTFQKLVEDFIAEYQIDVATVVLNGKAEDGVFQDTFAEPLLAERWLAFHNASAVLRVVSRTANLSTLRRK